MCGVVVLRAHSRVPDLDFIGRKALFSLAHRGPDDEGWIHVEKEGSCPPTFLGHRRLSILDLSSDGHQPMVCPDTGNVLVFNGEIYNYIELRSELKALGCRFHSETDTEVVMHAWSTWGEEAFCRFNGMWAIVLLERATGSLISCRDRLGVKPLYYVRHRDERGVWTAFASEIRAITSILGMYPVPDRRAVFEFLVSGLSDQGTRTFFEGIAAIPPGWIMRLTKDGDVHWRRYHQWPDAKQASRLEPEYVRELVSDAVRVRLRSDVPTVSLLSGGLDSSIITSRAAYWASQDQHANFAGAYTYGYADPQLAVHDETDRAKKFLARCLPNLAHTVSLASGLPSGSELLELARVQEEPIATPSVLASYRLYRAIKENGFKVVLSGEGADEIFGGYVKRYMSLMVRDRIADGNWRMAYRLLQTKVAQPGLVANRVVWDLPVAMVRPLLRRMRPSVRVMSDDLWGSMGLAFNEIREDRRLRLESRLHQDITTTNLPMILRFADRNSMRFGIEVRSPYLDWRIATAALSSPILDRMGCDHGKLALRRAYEADFPGDVIWGRKTHGFGNAEQYQINRFPLDGLWDRLPSWASDWVSVENVRRELKRPRSHPSLWWSLSLLLWFAAVYGQENAMESRQNSQP